MPSGRDIPSGLADRLKLSTATLCMCVKVAREDGITMAFTTHDEDVILGGLQYEALSAIQSTNIRQQLGGDVDNVDVVGVLKSTRITDDDLRAGAYDNADVTMSLCDWSDPSLGSVVLMRGNIGDISLTEDKYTASFRSLMQRFRQQIGELYSPGCRVFQLGDSRCKFDLTGNTLDGHPARSNVMITSILDQKVLLISGGVTAVGYYNYGTIKANAGRNTGYIREIKLHGSGSGLATATASPTGIPSGNLSFKRSYDFTSSLNAVFSIPAGVWETASLLITSNWSIINVLDEGTDQLTMQFPSGQVNDIVVRSNSVHSATYNDVLTLGDTTVGLINAVAGGSMTLVLRHTQQSPANHHYFNVNVSSVVLTLTGPGAGTSNRIVLHEAFPFQINVGEVFQITTGCNRLAGTCIQKFGNIINFRGEPTLPGTQKILERGRPPS